MKKVILAVAVAVLVSSLSFGQWQESFYVDEFGEKTEDSFMYIISNDGTFSNSATQNSKLKCQFMLNDDSLSIKVYEYGRSLATGSEGTFEKVKIKTPSDEIVEIKKVFFSKGGFLYFSKKNFIKVNETLKEKGDYMMIFNKSSSYSNSSYKIKFTI